MRFLRNILRAMRSQDQLLVQIEELRAQVAALERSTTQRFGITMTSATSTQGQMRFVKGQLSKLCKEVETLRLAVKKGAHHDRR